MGGVEIPEWLLGLPFAPEFRPTDTEFADPITYISKIEKEASAFGICKIIPPFPKPSKKYVISNLNKSLLRSSELSGGVNVSNLRSSSKLGSVDDDNEREVRAVFTTRHQELGQSVRKTKGVVQNPQLGVHKQVWQSGEAYTLEQFESKSKAFARSVLSGVKEPSPLAVESLFWKAACDKPIYVEYANDVPGSAFGEPEGKFRYFHRRRRKRNYFQRSKEQSSELKSGESATLMDFHSMDSVGTSTMDNLNASPEMSKSSATTVSLDDPSHHSRGKGSNSCIEMEGSAGWKLSNSPWNLQVIARSPGSLTRFMPDDIPGVTSPMVYIGMLFSWFAWHVEDHELHSMNFLHVGSPKTWYSIPGDYAFAFEDVVRAKAYGGSVDHLAALTLLGEKTTLLSPEVVIASGIPCCRLIQNPGEFVVTFPRAYHVGFSHGFNCGEAANFGTSQWLSVAKEAAVRRAAMNYLPMLSHQQLLYLLTMSFVSRVPRSLLPGVRSSRLLSRQKEERELLVKKSFVEDILGENNMLSILLEKEPSCRAVLWNPDMLPYLSKDSQLPNAISAVATSPRENVYCNHSETLTSNDKNMQNNFVDEMTLNLETMNDMYLESDDLSCDFQVDSGTLACVACGILGFPFMSVVQPSEKAARELLCVDNLSIDKRLGVFGPEIDHCSPHFGGTHTEDSTSVPDVNRLLKDLSVVSIPKCNKGWNKSSKFFRPRSFCLQHAVDIIELLQSKGGANILVICHSDYHKIKANAVAISEEIGNRFVYNEVQLDVASEDDLRLIDLAVDEERGECGEDWTSRLGINLRHCVKVRKNSPTKQVKHALKLGGLFLDRTPGFNFLTINWLSKKSRSKKIYMLCKPFKSMPIKDEVTGENSDCKIGKREEKFVQYYRRNKKSGNSTAVGSVAQPPSHRDSSSICNLSELGITDPAGMIEMRHDAVLHKTDYTNANPATSLAADSPSTLVGRISETEIGNCMSEDIDGESYNLPGDVFEVQQKIMTTLDKSELNKKVASNLTSPLITAIDESFEMRQEQEIMGSHHKTNEACNIVSDGQLHALTDEDAFMKDINLAKPLGLHDSIHVGNLKEEMENAVVGKLSNEVFDGVTRDDVEQEFTSPNRIKDKVQDSCNFILAKQQHFLDIEDLSQSGRLEDGVEREVMSTCESNTSEPILMNIRSPNLKDRTSVVSRVVCAASNICSNAVTSGDVVNDLQTIDTDTETRPVSGVLVQLEVQLSHSVEDNKYLENLESLEVMADENSLEILESQEGKDHHVNTLMLSTVIQNEIPTTMPESVSNFGILGGSQPMHVEVTGVACEKEKFTGGLTPDNDVECANLSTTEHSSKPVSRYDMSTGSPLNPIHFETQMETCDATEICLSKYDRQGENIKDLKSNPSPNLEKQKKRNRDEECIFENGLNSCDFIRSPCEGLRPRVGRNLADRKSDVNITVQEKPDRKKVRRPSDADRSESDVNITVQKKPDRKKVRRPSDAVSSKVKKEIRKQAHKCDLEGCRMSFETKAELALHKRNQCPHEGCGKRFSSHKYAMLHKRVHDDDRPLKCPWKGCSMSFKWAWARTEHIRVHTGERPYKCKVDGCGLSFRFVSDYSRHRRKTGHYVDQPV